jgi:hypothetical protein
VQLGLARDTIWAWGLRYEQLAGAFRAAGDSIKANRILYESRRRARAERKLEDHASYIANWLKNQSRNTCPPNTSLRAASADADEPVIA